MWCFYHMMLPQRCRIGQFVVCYFCKIIFDQHTWTLKWHISQENLYCSQSWKACDLMIHVKTFMWHVTGEIAVWNHIRILFTLDPILIEMHFSCLMYCMKCGCCCFRTILSDSQICQKMEQFMNWRATWVSLKTIVLYIAPFTVLHQSEIPNKIRLSLCSENPKTRWCHAVDTMSNFWIHCTYTNIYNF